MFVLSLVSCLGSTEPGLVLERRPGVLSVGSPPVVTVPAEGAVGVPIPIIVETFGGGCVRQGDTESNVSGLAANVTPYDSVVVHLPSHMACTDDLRRYTHHASLTFAAAGSATVRVHGTVQPNGTAIIVERTIQIR
jgi:hypothetical protein